MDWLWGKALDWAERGRIPDSLLRAGIRRLCAERLQEERHRNQSSRDFAQQMSSGPVAPVPEKANEQHYEAPPELFEAALGARLKYSCCHWPRGVTTLDQAEEAALVETCRRADLTDGQDILELGCGWGSLSLWMAESYPRSRITAVSNSQPQRKFIEGRARRLGLSNLRVVTCDMNKFSTELRFDRVVSVEMFEHMRNYEELLSRVAGWMKPNALLFIHVFCHERFAYAFQSEGATQWLGRHFFTGGIMPSRDLLRHFSSDLQVQQEWTWSGTDYEKTANAWLANMDACRSTLMPVLAKHYGESEASRWFQRWRIFFMACAELWGFQGGREWLVAHYLLRPTKARQELHEIDRDEVLTTV